MFSDCFLENTYFCSFLSSQHSFNIVGQPTEMTSDCLSYTVPCGVSQRGDNDIYINNSSIQFYLFSFLKTSTCCMFSTTNFIKFLIILKIFLELTFYSCLFMTSTNNSNTVLAEYITFTENHPGSYSKIRTVDFLLKEYYYGFSTETSVVMSSFIDS